MDLSSLYCLDIYLKDKHNLLKIKELIGYSRQNLEDIGNDHLQNNSDYLVLLYEYNIADVTLLQK